MGLDRNDWQRLSALLDEAMDVEAGARTAWLAARPDVPEHLRPLLERLLRERQGDDEFTLPPLARFTDADLAELADGETPAGVAWDGMAPGADVGPYRLIREIGTGGMGSVWLAERNDGAFKREVALKLPHSALPRAQLAERFARERNILAALAHPHIARLYDAGVTVNGRPWLAMEYVAGKTLGDYCRDNLLDLDARLRLFQQVIRAIQYAHSQLVVHRDLKPGNILVTTQGHVRLLDFGIATLLDADADAATPLTEMAGRALTPQYAAPEQILGRPIGIGADIYSLGVLLYELLTGSLPYRLKRDSRGAWEDAIVELDPPLPSRAAKGAFAGAGDLAGDLDTILLKTLKKDPAERYATAAAFAEDIDRYLGGRVVLARADSGWYRTRKFVRRHRWGIAAMTAVVLALASGLGVALWQARVAREEAQTARAVEEFVTGIFLANSVQQPDPMKARDTTARQLLDIGAAKVDTALKDAPKAKVRMLKIFVELYGGVGLDAVAAEFADRQVALTREVHGPDSLELVEALLAKLELVSDTPSQPTLRRQLLDEAQAILERRGDTRSAHYGEFLTRSARYWADRDIKRALADALRATNILRGTPQAFDIFLSAAGIAQASGDYATARNLATEGLAAVQQVADTGEAAVGANQGLPVLHQILGDVAWSENNLAEAERELRASHEAAGRIFGSADGTTIGIGAHFAEFLHVIGKQKESERLLAAFAAALDERPQGEAAWVLSEARVAMGKAYATAGRADEALRQLTPILPKLTALEASPVYADWLRSEAAALFASGRHAEAREVLQRAIAIREKADIRPWDVLRQEAILGAELALAEGQPAAAGALLAAQTRDAANGPSPDGIRVLALRARVARAAGDPSAARVIARETLAAIDASPQRPFLGRYEAGMREQLR